MTPTCPQALKAIALCAVFLLVVGCRPAVGNATPTGDLARLQGRWVPVGQSAKTSEGWMEFRGDQWKALGVRDEVWGRREETRPVALDEGEDPKFMRILLTTGTTYLELAYEIEGDSLWVSMPIGGRPRSSVPTDWKTNPEWRATNYRRTAR